MSRSEAAEAGDGSYLGEIRRNWRPVAAASAGLGAGTLLNHYIGHIFAPHLLEAFGWSKSSFALTGTLGLLTLIFIPLAGRMADLLGVRRVALIGVVSLPLTFVAFSMMNGNIFLFAAITVVQNLLAGVTTTSTVYSRLIAERFVTARGLALAIAATTPALVGIVGSPLLDGVIHAHGWRIGYLAVAAYVAIIGSVALMLIPGRASVPEAGSASRPPRRRAAADYRLIMRSRAFWIIFVGMLLCNLIYPLQSSQMKLMLLENGVDSTAGSWMISLFAVGVMLGRFGCGLALDRFPPHLVAAIGMGLPAIGLLSLALGFNAPAILAGSVVLLGLSLGAESDLAAFLVIRFFRIDIYSTVVSLVVVAIGVAAVLGSVMLSLTLRLVHDFSLYMLLGGIASLAGSALFLLLGREAIVRAAER